MLRERSSYYNMQHKLAIWYCDWITKFQTITKCNVVFRAKKIIAVNFSIIYFLECDKWWYYHIFLDGLYKTNWNFNLTSFFYSILLYQFKLFKTSWKKRYNFIRKVVFEFSFDNYSKIDIKTKTYFFKFKKYLLNYSKITFGKL